MSLIKNFAWITAPCRASGIPPRLSLISTLRSSPALAPFIVLPKSSATPSLMARRSTRMRVSVSLLSSWSPNVMVTSAMMKSFNSTLGSDPSLGTQLTVRFENSELFLVDVGRREVFDEPFELQSLVRRQGELRPNFDIEFVDEIALVGNLQFLDIEIGWCQG